MKPDWSSKNVPDWANYAAQEASGSWYWYSHRPTYSEICTEWQSPGQRQIIPKVELRPQETLEERPDTWWQGFFLLDGTCVQKPSGRGYLHDIRAFVGYDDDAQQE